MPEEKSATPPVTKPSTYTTEKPKVRHQKPQKKAVKKTT